MTTSSNYDYLIKNLNHQDVNVRLDSLQQLMKLIDQGKLKPPEPSGFVNNHIHTTYSFSPYSPTKALWMAYNAGLTTAGIMDHDSISGAEEFIKAGKIIGIATTIGVECRADFSQTILNGKLINNPDQKSIAYVALHGIPHTKIDTVKAFFQPFSEKRNQRNSAMVNQLNRLLKSHGIQLDFAKDVVPLSNGAEGGSITERHILYALSLKLIEKFGKGQDLVNFLKQELKLEFSSKLTEYLLDETNEYYSYDLLGVLKGDLVQYFYIPATDECPAVSQVVNLSQEIGCILAYAYLGDVAESVTGDKKAQKFEDDYLEQLFKVLAELKFNAITYMPSRNTMAQLKRVKKLCSNFNFFEISGEDINSPRQSFVCDALAKPEFTNLVDSTWALIGHEITATKDITRGLFAEQTIKQYPELDERIKVFKAIGLANS